MTLRYEQILTSHSAIAWVAECEEISDFSYSRTTQSCSLANKCIEPSMLIRTSNGRINGTDHVYADLDAYPAIRNNLALSKWAFEHHVPASTAVIHLLSFKFTFSTPLLIVLFWFSSSRSPLALLSLSSHFPLTLLYSRSPFALLSLSSPLSPPLYLLLSISSSHSPLLTLILLLYPVLLLFPSTLSLYFSLTLLLLVFPLISLLSLPTGHCFHCFYF